MPTSRPRGAGSRGSDDRSRRRTISVEKASSFHGRGSAFAVDEAAAMRQLQRPRTAPDLTLGRGGLCETPPPLLERPRLTKLLLNVMIRGSAGTIQVLMPPDSTVGDLVSAAVREYVKGGRRPLLAMEDPSFFDLHYSQFSLDSLSREEKLIELGTRNFFVCPKKPELGGAASSTAANCSQEAEVGDGSCFDLLNFMDFLL
ncbi:hypothetical protein SAY86_014226 [Trapa natans]|uniref:DUF7054 domain-containing protein n=1 Tax=Trapa natans TaxID=22666 RepID=A0AAN7KSS0_TRANT|nr:hypothetical protein SAY86_014226 [Trapa natans]